MTFVIASTSTTDWDGRNPVEVYDIFLMRPEKRVSAWWNRYPGDAETFETREQAQAEMERLFPEGRSSEQQVRELVPGWYPKHYGANPETFVIEWYATRQGEQGILCGTREEARAKCRELNAALRATDVIPV